MRTVVPAVQPRDRLVGTARNEGSKAFGLMEPCGRRVMPRRREDARIDETAGVGG